MQTQFVKVFQNSPTYPVVSMSIIIDDFGDEYEVEDFPVSAGIAAVAFALSDYGLTEEQNFYVKAWV